MRKSRDVTGETFGMLSVIERVPERKGHSYYRVRCECGNESVVTVNKLTSGKTKSCGKHRTGIEQTWNRKEYGEGNKNIVIDYYKRNAMKKGHEFSLTDEETLTLLKSNCYYCGCVPNNVTFRKGTYGEFVHNGIDRMDNSKGYVNGNVVPCCKECNYKKGATNHDDFIAWIRRIAERFS